MEFVQNLWSNLMAKEKYFGERHVRNSILFKGCVFIEFFWKVSQNQIKLDMNSEK